MGEQRPKKKLLSIKDFPQSYIIIIIIIIADVLFATWVYRHGPSLAHSNWLKNKIF